MNQNIDDKATKAKKVEFVSLTISDDRIKAEIADYAKSVNKKRRLKLFQTLLICAAVIMAITGCIYFKAHYDAAQREMLSGEASAQPVPVEQSGSPVASPNSTEVDSEIFGSPVAAPPVSPRPPATFDGQTASLPLSLPSPNASFASSHTQLPTAWAPATPIASDSSRPWPLSPPSHNMSKESSRPLSPPCSSLEYPQDASASAKSSATTTSSNAAPPTAATQPHTREAPLSPARSLSPPPPGSANDWMQQFQSSL